MSFIPSLPAHQHQQPLQQQDAGTSVDPMYVPMSVSPGPESPKATTASITMSVGLVPTSGSATLSTSVSTPYLPVHAPSESQLLYVDAHHPDVTQQQNQPQQQHVQQGTGQPGMMENVCMIAGKNSTFSYYFKLILLTNPIVPMQVHPSNSINNSSNGRGRQ